MEIDNYQNVISYLNKKKRGKHLLLGNGFSMSYDKKIFSYNAFSDFIKKTDNQLLQKLFGIINTCNFKLIMSQLDESSTAEIFLVVQIEGKRQTSALDNEKQFAR